MSVSLKMNNSSSFNLIFCPPYSGNMTVSPCFTKTGISFPWLSYAPGPHSTIFPYELVSGLLIIIPEVVLV